MTFKDHFSAHAGLYAQARPHYPDALFDRIAQTAPAHDCVWDAACGNGQASVALARRFACVVATDPSAQQIAQAEQNARIEYRVESAESSSLGDRSVDAITVAQALHWFDLPRFAAEARRVAKPRALFAAWTYAGCSVDAEVDETIATLYDGILGGFWPPERRWVDEGYASLQIPFAKIETPHFEMRVQWNTEQLLAYLKSWSAAQRYQKQTGRDAIAQITGALRKSWGDPQRERAVRWQLALRAARID